MCTLSNASRIIQPSFHEPVLPNAAAWPDTVQAEFDALESELAERRCREAESVQDSLRCPQCGRSNGGGTGVGSVTTDLCDHCLIDTVLMIDSALVRMKLKDRDMLDRILDDVQAVGA